MADTDFVQAYVDAAADSSNRTRLVFLVLIIASVLSFSATWNSSRTSWLNSRVQVTEDVQRWWPYLVQDSAPRLDDESLKARYDQASRYYSKRVSINDSLALTRIQSDLSLLREARVKEVILVRIPFFGVTFDINDLGLIAGFGFSVIMMWLMFSIASELRDMRHAFAYAKEIRALSIAYDLLLMRQVLTTPPARYGKPITWLGWLIRPLYTLPFLVQSYTWWHDIGTWDLGESLSPVATRIGTIGGGIFLMMILLLTIFCFYFSREVDQEWKATFAAVASPDTRPPT